MNVYKNMEMEFKNILILTLLCGCLSTNVTNITSFVVNLPGDTYNCGSYSNT